MPLGVLSENTEQVSYCKLKPSEAESRGRGRNKERSNCMLKYREGGPFSTKSPIRVGKYLLNI
jgi:hypothetical protein